MRRVTDAKRIKDTTKTLLRISKIDFYAKQETSDQHPFADSPFMPGKNGELLNLTIPEEREVWNEMMEQLIDNSSVNDIIYTLINHSWCITWLQMIREWLSRERFAEYLAYAWTIQENPITALSVDNATVIKWFKYANKKLLMTPQEYERWEDLPDEVVLYQYIVKGTKVRNMSWFLEQSTAEWTQKQYMTSDVEYQLVKVVTSKQNCLSYFDRRIEGEIVLDLIAAKQNITVIE